MRASKGRSGSKLLGLCLLAAAPLTLACNIEGNVGGLADTLLDPEPASIDSPGRKIVSGQYSSLELDASLSVGARLLALRHDREDAELAVIPFEGGDACHVSDVQRFLRLASQVDINLPPIISVLGNLQDGRGTLRFIDFGCQEVMPALEDVSLPQVLYPRSAPTGFLALSGSGTVHFLDVVERKVSTVAENVRIGRVGSKYLWLVEQGELLARDDKFDVKLRYGTDVQDFALFSGLKEQGVTDVVYLEAGTVYLAAGGADEAVALADDACSITDVGHSGVFAFYSPCAARRLNLAYKASLAGLDDADIQVTALSEQTIDPRQIDLFWGDGYGAALFITNADGASDRGDLTLQVFDAETSEAETATVLESSAHIGTGGVVRVDYTGTSGTVMRAVVEVDDDGRPQLASLDPIAEGVAQLPGVTISSSLGVLANYDDSAATGELVLFSYDLDEPPTRLAQGVPIQRHARDATRQRSAFVADFDGETGMAYMVDGKTVTPLGQGVLPGTLAFVEMPNAVAYLSNRDGRKNALTLYLLEPETEAVVNVGVNEFHGLPWPSPGILYSVSEGADPGIWFARAR